MNLQWFCETIRKEKNNGWKIHRKIDSKWTLISKKLYFKLRKGHYSIWLIKITKQIISLKLITRIYSLNRWKFKLIRRFRNVWWKFVFRWRRK